MRNRRRRGLCPPHPPEFGALAADASGHDNETGRASQVEARPSGVQPTNGRSGRTPAEPYPPASKSCGRGKDAYRPAPDHPWRRTG